MIIRRNADFTSSPEDLDCSQVAFKIKNKNFMGAVGLSSLGKYLNIEFENEEELILFFKALKLFKDEYKCLTF